MTGLLAVAAGTLASEDLACVSAGVLVARGAARYLPAAFACFAGIWAGDVALFLAGRWLGRAALERWPLRRLLTAERLEAASEWCRRRGPAVVLLARFLPGARLPAYVAAGALRTDLLSFSLWFLLASAIWAPLLVGAAAYASGWRGPAAAPAGTSLPAAVAAALAVLGGTRLAFSLAARRGRRLLASRLRRLVRWEHWPPWIVQAPVAAHVLLLGLRHRSLTLFTAANPGLDAGGFVGESKSAILRALRRAGAPIARFTLLGAGSPLEERLRRAAEFLRAEGLTYPVVLKPDVGQRGEGVVVIRSEGAMAGHLASARRDVILQEHVAGPEFGIFYVRRPGEARGRIVSMTEKRLPRVVGDGRRSLEELILADGRLLPMAPLHMKRHAARLREVPAAGEEVALGDVGNHCRGAIFLDGALARTPDLEETIDRIASACEGFFFGRFDVRASSVGALRRGIGFRILELNGVTSEATHVYDARYGLLDAWRVQFGLWRTAFEIGALNRARGAVPAPLLDILARIARHLLRAAAPAPHRRSGPRRAGAETQSVRSISKGGAAGRSPMGGEGRAGGLAAAHPAHRG